MIVGIVMVLLGVIWLLVNTGVINAAVWTLVWPLVIIYLGVVMLMRSRERSCPFCHMMERKKEWLEKHPEIAEKKYGVRSKKAGRRS
jgi:hypothetical protein